MIPAAPTAPGSDAEAGDRCRAVGARDRTSARAHGDARCRRGELLADPMPSWRGAELLIAERLKQARFWARAARATAQGPQI